MSSQNAAHSAQNMARVFGGSVTPASVWTPVTGGRDGVFMVIECSYSQSDGRHLCGKRDRWPTEFSKAAIRHRLKWVGSRRTLLAATGQKRSLAVRHYRFKAFLEAPRLSTQSPHHHACGPATQNPGHARSWATGQEFTLAVCATCSRSFHPLNGWFKQADNYRGSGGEVERVDSYASLWQKA